MKPLTQIILVGHTMIRLLEGIKRFPLNKLILLVGKNRKLEGEDKVYEVASDLEDRLRNIAEIEMQQINKDAVYPATIDILHLILREVKNQHKIMLNLSGSLRHVSIACYMAALVSGTPSISVIPRYSDSYYEIGVEKIYNVPTFPIKELSDERLMILRILKARETDSMQQLMIKLYGDKSLQARNKTRAKLSYYVKDLIEDGFVKKYKKGKSVQLSLTEMGHIFLLGNDIKEIKNTFNRKII